MEAIYLRRAARDFLPLAVTPETLGTLIEAAIQAPGAIAALPDPDRQAFDRRYGSLSLEPRTIKFIDRLVADSREVALHQTAGLSPPRQAMMTLFSLVALADQEQPYRTASNALPRRRCSTVWA